MEPLKNKVTEIGSNPPKGTAKSAGFKGLLAAQIEGLQKNKSKKEEVDDGGHVCENKLEVITEEGVVKYLKVYCRCGEVIQIECQYSE